MTFRMLLLALLALVVKAAGGSQTISFDAIPNQIFGIPPFMIAAQASSGLPISIVSTTTAVCQTASGLVTLLSAGTCSITASQTGNGSYSAATSVTQSFSVKLANRSGSLMESSGSPLVVGSEPYSLVVGDFNGDGIQDLVTANANSGNVTVLLGNGSGGFAPAMGSPFAVGATPRALVAGDFNGDGIQDLATANSASNNVTVLLGNGSGGFTLAAGSPFAAGTSPFSMVVGDFNGDGIQDLAMANEFGADVTVLLGNGSGGFTAAAGSPFAVGTSPLCVVVGDFNGDGIQDLATANFDSSNVTVLLGNGSGGFTPAPGSPFAVGSSPASVVVGDVNGNGIQDLVTANYGGNNVTVLLGNGSGGFTPVAGSPFAVGTNPFSVEVGDFNGDGIQDLVTANYGSNDVTILTGNGSGGFTAASGSPFAVGTFPISSVVGDFNGDGIEDLATADAGTNRVTVLLGLLVGDTSQTITFGPLSGVAYGVSPFGIGATASSGLVVSFASTTPAVCRVTGNAVAIVGAGTCSIVASQAGNATYAAAATVSQSFEVAPFTITSVTPNATPAGNGATLVTVAGQNLSTASSLSFTPPGGAPVTVSLSAIQATEAAAAIPAGLLATAGTAQVALANGAGVLSNRLPFYITPFTITSVTPNAAPGASAATAVTIAGQNLSTATTLAFTPPGGAPVMIGLTAIQSAQATATIPATLLTSAGMAQVALANGAGVLSNQLPFAIGTPQTITFAALSDVPPGTQPLGLTATASSTLPVTYVSTTPSVCTVSGTTVTTLISGGCSITASQPGNTTYAPAPPVTQEFTVLFNDISPTASYAAAVDLFAQYGITGGCGNDDFCANAPVTRAEMAVFIVTSIFRGASFNYSPTPHFADVPASGPGSFGFKWIQAMDELGITGGCAKAVPPATLPTFCPNESVTREQMAVFLMVARFGGSNFTYSPTPSFADVPDSGATANIFQFVQRMKQDGITGGCAKAVPPATLPTFCPDEAVSRAQMAVFMMVGMFNQFLPAGTPLITGISPSVLPVGTSGTFTITGVNTNFAQGTTTLSPIPGVTIGTITVNSATSLTVQLTAAASATPRPYTIVAITNSEQDVFPNGLIVQ